MKLSEDLPPTQTLAALYEKQGLLRQAEDVYRKLLDSDPNRLEIQEALQALQKRQKKKRPAKRDYQSILQTLQQWKYAIDNRLEAVSRKKVKGLRVAIVVGPRLLVTQERADVLPDTDFPDAFEQRVKGEAEKMGVAVEMVPALDEAAFAKVVLDALERCDALVINPEFLEPASLDESILAATHVPIVEVRLENSREASSQQSKTMPFVRAALSGFGEEGFVMAMHSVVEMAMESRGS